MGRLQPLHVGVKARTHMLLPEYVVQEFGKLCSQQILGPLRRDRFHCLDCTQVVIGVPERERTMQPALT
jgi:hypothetical protein